MTTKLVIRLLLCVMLLGYGASTVAAQAESISDADRAFLTSHMRMTRQFLVDATRGLSRPQWLYKPGPARWSIAQCVDHLAATEEYVLDMVSGRLMESDVPIRVFPSLGGADTALRNPPPLPREADALTILAMVDRTPSVAVPVEQRPPIEEIAPRSAIDDPEGVLDRFLAARQAMIDYARTTTDDLRHHFATTTMRGYYPAYEFQDGYQWLLRMSAHAERHTVQIHEVKDSPGYPKR